MFKNIKKLFKSKAKKKSKNIIEESKQISAAYSVPEPHKLDKSSPSLFQKYGNNRSETVQRLNQMTNTLDETNEITKSAMTNKTSSQSPTPQPSEPIQSVSEISTSSESDGGSSFAFVPVRQLDDFLCGTSRYNFPTIDSLGNRVKKNLLYYQTNYGIIALSIMSIMVMNHPMEFFLGIFLSYGIGLASTAFTGQVFGPLAWIGYSLFIFNYCKVYFSALVVSSIVILTHATLRLQLQIPGNKIEKEMDNNLIKQSLIRAVLNVSEELIVDSD